MTSGALRQRRHRERERDGRLVVSIELDSDDIETLIEARTLDPRKDCHSREAIAAAIKSYLQISRDA